MLQKLPDEFAGDWWLPGEEDAKAPGILEVGGTVELKLLSAIGHQRYPRNGFDLKADLVLGRSMRYALTLVDCQGVGYKTSDDQEQVHHQALVNHVLIGYKHITRVEDLRFNRATFHLSHLNEWLNRPPYSFEFLGDGAERVTVSLPEPILVQVPSCEVIAGRDLTSKHGYLDVAGFESQESIYLKLDEPQSIDDIQYHYIRPLRHLMSLATGDACEEVSLEVWLSGENETPLDRFEVLGYRSRSLKRPASRVNLQMRFAANRGNWPPEIDPATAVARWFAIEAHMSHVCDLVFSLRESNSYLEHQLFTAASAAEGMHRALYPAVKTTYVEKIKELVSLAGPSVTARIGDVEQWAGRLRDARNVIAHADGQDKDDIEQKICMMQSAQMLCEIVLLRRLGFSEVECETIAGRDWEWQFLGSAMRGAFPKFFGAGS